MYDFTGVTGAKVVIYDSSAAQSGKLSATADIVGAIANVTEGNAFTLFSGTLDASGVTVSGSGEGSFGAGINSLGKVYVHGGTIVGGQVNGSLVHHGGGAIAVSGANAALYMTNGVIEKGFTTCGGAVLVQGGATFTMDGGNISKGKATYDGGNVFVWGGTFNMNGGTIMDGVLGNNARYGTNVAFNGSNTFTMTGGTITGGSATMSTAHGGVYVPAATKMTVSGNAKINGNTVAGKASNLYLDDSTLTIGGKGLTGTAKIGVTLGDGKGVTSTSVSGDFTTGTNVTAAQRAYFTHDGGIGIVFGGNNTPLYCGNYGYQVGYAERDYGEICLGMGLSGYSNNAQRICETYDETYGLDIEVLAVTDDNGNTAVICSVEAATISTSFHTELRKLVANTYGIPMENVMITSNHQHSTPSPGDTATYRDSQGNITKRGKEFNDQFKQLFMAAVDEALQTREVTEVYTKTVTTTKHNYVRNDKAYDASGRPLGMITDGHVYIGCPESTTDPNFYSYLLAEEGAGDPDMQLVWFDRTTKRDIVLANFAVHPHGFGLAGFNNLEANANFTGRFRDAVSNAAGMNNCYTMYITGAAGDLNMEPKPYLKATAYGDFLRYEAYADINDYVSGLVNLVPQLKTDLWNKSTTGQVNAVAQTLVLPANDAGLHLYEEAKAISSHSSINDRTAALKNYQAVAANRTEARYIYSIYHADAIVNRYNYIQPNSSEPKTTKDMPVYAISIGGVSFGGVPYEMFSADGRAVKAGNNEHDTTIICYLANGHNGYIPSAQHWKNGGYSVDIAYTGETASAQLNAKLIEMLNGLK